MEVGPKHKTMETEPSQGSFASGASGRNTTGLCWRTWCHVRHVFGPVLIFCGFGSHSYSRSLCLLSTGSQLELSRRLYSGNSQFDKNIEDNDWHTKRLDLWCARWSGAALFIFIFGTLIPGSSLSLCRCTSVSFLRHWFFRRLMTLVFLCVSNRTHFSGQSFGTMHFSCISWLDEQHVSLLRFDKFNITIATNDMYGKSKFLVQADITVFSHVELLFTIQSLCIGFIYTLKRPNVKWLHVWLKFSASLSCHQQQLIWQQQRCTDKKFKHHPGACEQRPGSCREIYRIEIRIRKTNWSSKRLLQSFCNKVIWYWIHYFL